MTIRTAERGGCHRCGGTGISETDTCGTCHGTGTA